MIVLGERLLPRDCNGGGRLTIAGSSKGTHEGHLAAAQLLVLHWGRANVRGAARLQLHWREDPHCAAPTLEPLC